MKPQCMRALSLSLVLIFLSIIQGCALKPSKEQQREMAFNLVFNIVTVKAAATAYSVASMFTFTTNTLLENFNMIAEKDSGDFSELEEQLPVKLMLVVSKFRPKAKELVFQNPEYMDEFIETPLFQQGISLAKKAEDFGLPDLTEELNDKQVGLWMQVFMSSKQKVKELAEPLSEYNEQIKDYFNIRL